MKHSILFFAILTFAAIACKNEPGVKKGDGGPNSDMINNPVTADLPTDTNLLARIMYDMPTYEFGTVNEGDVVTHKFTFTNTGKVPLTILKARSTCGCTVPEWPEEPIPPGGKGEITASFNTEGKMNNQTKTITVTANTYPNETRVKLVGIVNPKKDSKE
ncbi:MAG: DUF1573 domain-containing protein [Saprospiraceae bacterium]|nr:DUF1573 domain-containing protein [Saprospiraceae bacterium]